MEKSLAIVTYCAPYSAAAREALDALFAAASLDIPVQWFVAESSMAMLIEHGDTHVLGQRSRQKKLKMLALFEIAAPVVIESAIDSQQTPLLCDVERCSAEQWRAQLAKYSKVLQFL
ncbi:hypothetical protein CWI84_00370 [Idiomarina tyrosinivorans]|uniref:Uncharacterized protein n=1 Tax=Idiomarina tyrosinivorans TaxID=1445662 RepID=A0A432ZTJ2_9GAMM|nr:DsrE family protein [Idiomarina tyrosinivorans]RUO81255.1 hypothetical protein CWI84_00370 [Idiomarina tyrosinivorans]